MERATMSLHNKLAHVNRPINPRINRYDTQREFADAMRRRGLVFDDIIADGKIHRCDVYGKKPGGRQGAYLLHLDGDLPAGGFQNWTDDNGWENWHHKTGRPLTSSQRKYLEQIKAEVAAMHECQYQKAAQRARDIWDGACDATDRHPYLKKKRVRSHGLRKVGSDFLVPIWNQDRDMQSVQMIGADGDKRFLKDGRVGGGYFQIGKASDTACICEGFATGASINESTGHGVFVAFNAGNLANVAKLVRERYPDASIIICADDDWRTSGNPGLTRATEAADAVGGRLAVPKFGDNRADDDTDFNDMTQAVGAESVARIIDDVQRSEQKSETRIILPADDPMACAEEFLAHKFTTSGGSCLFYYRANFYRWAGTHYIETDAKEVRSRLYAFLKSAFTTRREKIEPFKPNQSKVNQILDALESGVFQSSEDDAPFWIKPPPGYIDAGALIACRNGLLDIATRTLHRHTPDFFNVNCLPFAYDPDAPHYPKR
jgi:putative DNA primase/helicase